MKIASFNVKGLTDLKKAHLVKQWLRSKGLLDIIVLVEIKVTGEELNRRLNSISPSHFWIHTLHTQGSGGLAIGIHHDLCSDLKGFHIGYNNQWISAYLNSFTIVGVYAHGPQKQRTETWKSLTKLQAPTLICGDFNMVETLLDRFKAKGQAVFGREKLAWQKLKRLLRLQDLGQEGSFSWQNYSPGPLSRKARLDRAYASNEVVAMYNRCECLVDTSTCISDHYPIIITMDNLDIRHKAGWFHTDPALFKLPLVKEEIEQIWTSFFSANLSPAKAWNLAIKSTQNLLKQVRKEVTALRINRLAKLQEQLRVQEASPNPGNLNQIRAQIKREEEIALQQAKLFSREWWAGKTDRPCREMFKMLKVKQRQEHLPLLRFKNGVQALNHEENKKLLSEHYRATFLEAGPPSPSKLKAMEEISKLRKSTVPSAIAKALESDITHEELKEVIYSLKPNKSPGEDGLTSEFYQTFSEVLVDPIIQVWREATRFGSLPTQVNQGLIKLIHKKGPKEEVGNWRPLTMLNSVYKIIAKALARRLTLHMDSWISKEQKGFIKGRFILDAIIALWEGFEYAEKSNQDFLFLKIDFEKAYDKIHWDFILQSLRDMGLGPQFTHMVKTLFGNAKAKVIYNGELSAPFPLQKSIRQGCPLAPLLYAIASDGLNWLIKDRVKKGALAGIRLPNGEQMCTQMFADDTNCLISNEEGSIKALWECLQIYCSASGSSINHFKTGIKSLIEPPPEWLKAEGCNIIPDGEIFRLLGIPMGFKVSLRQRWQWVMEKIDTKLLRWKRKQLSLAGRIMVLNHFILPYVTYFLSCWRPPESDLCNFTKLCRNFLWGGDPWNKSIPKVKWDICTTPKDKGGLGIQDISDTANRMAAKWIIRAYSNPSEDWAQLLIKDTPRFGITGFPKWKNLPLSTIVISRHPISPKGSQLVTSIWKAWNHLKPSLISTPNLRISKGSMAYDSCWWSSLPFPPLQPEEAQTAVILHKRGIVTWADLRDLQTGSWLSRADLVAKFNCRTCELDLVESRTSQWANQDTWKLNFPPTFNIWAYQWSGSQPLLPIPKLSKAPPIHLSLNRRWNLHWDRKQWYHCLNNLWSPHIDPKKSCLAWLLAYRALWTQVKAAKFNVASSQCSRCGLPEDDLHIFLHCPYISQSLKTLQHIVSSWGKSLNWKQILLGEAIGCSDTLWNIIRTEYLWHSWILRLAASFNNPELTGPPLTACLITACRSFWYKRMPQLYNYEKKLENKLRLKASDYTSNKLDSIRTKINLALTKDRHLIHIICSL